MSMMPMLQRRNGIPTSAERLRRGFCLPVASRIGAGLTVLLLFTAALAEPVPLKNGSVVNGDISNVTAQGFDLKLPYGAAKYSWSQVDLQRLPSVNSRLFQIYSSFTSSRPPAAPVPTQQPAVTPPASLAPSQGDEPQNATTARPFVNSLGMKFVPVPGTEVLFCIWDTRVKDFEAFVNAARATATGAKTMGADLSQTRAMQSLLEVTDGKKMGADGRKHSGVSWKSPGFVQTGEHPVCCVGWLYAKLFCKWLTDKERGEGRLKASQEYRLHTRGEWNVAAGLQVSCKNYYDNPRGEDGRLKVAYPWGEASSPPAGFANYAGAEARDANWVVSRPTIPFYRDAYARTSPVGSFKANWFGLYDMSGNVWQCCEEISTSVGMECFARGGSWATGDLHSLNSFYSIKSSDDYGPDWGFRVVLANVSSRQPAQQRIGVIKGLLPKR